MDKIRAEFLEKYDFWYSENKKEILKNHEKAIKLLNQFKEKYSVDFIKNMQIDDYIVGKEDDDGKTRETFCWWVETNTRGLCEIRGGRLNAYQRFGIYYNAKLGEYVFKLPKAKNSRYGNNIQEVFLNIKTELVKLIKCIKNEDFAGIAAVKINPLVKNKITYLYSPETYLPIAGDGDLNVLLRLFDIPFNIEEDRIYKRKKLYDFYKSLCREDMSTQMFIDFVYNDLGYRTFLRTAEQELKVENIKAYKLVEVKSVENLIRSQRRERHGLVKETYETYNQKKISGKKGEEIVKAYLNSHKKQMKIQSVIDMACEYDDSKHYDIS